MISIPIETNDIRFAYEGTDIISYLCSKYIIEMCFILVTGAKRPGTLRVPGLLLYICANLTDFFP